VQGSPFPRGARPLAALAVLAALATMGTRASAGAQGSPLRPSGPAQVLVVGDSLAVGTQPLLGELLAYRQITWDARSGRTTPQGLLSLRADLRRVTPQTVVVSLGTNDGPDPARFANRLHRVLSTIPAGACVVWPAITRPPRKGAYHALDRVLRNEARRSPRLTVLGWDHAVARGSVVLPDGVHPDDAGFRYRSRMIAAAVQGGCDGQ
jgi:lysophospholipase L1-like esterase